MTEAVRQHYALATGKGLEKSASGPSGPRSKYAKGGVVKKEAFGGKRAPPFGKKK